MSINRGMLWGVFCILLGAIQLLYAWKAYIGQPESLAWALPGLDMLVSLMRVSSQEDANRLMAVVSSSLGVIFIVGGLIAIGNARKSK